MMRVLANFDNITGKIKPMHGVNLTPGPALLHYFKEAGIPYMRTHDVGGAYGGMVYVDITNLFRNFDADENDPANYDFAFTDFLFKNLAKNGTKPFFRLGETIEGHHMIKTYKVFAPKDPAKWARICEHVVRHYNEGWADGYHYDIEYWEIWGEPDSCYRPEEANLWKGTPEQYYELYEVTSKHLKACFGDSIKVGGYGAIGLYDYAKDPEGKGIDKKREDLTQREFYINFMHGFFKHITSEEHKSPIDFFSWHSYETFDFFVPQARYLRKVLDNYGLGHIEDTLDEWHICPYYKIGVRGTPPAASSTLATMLALQKEKTSVLCYYDARIGPSQYGGMFNPDTHKPYLTYYTFMMFNQLYKLGNEIETVADSDTLWIGGAKDDKKKVLVLVNHSDKEEEVELDISGADTDDVEILMINDVYQYTPTGKKIEDGKIVLPPYTCAEIRFY